MAGEVSVGRVIADVVVLLLIDGVACSCCRSPFSAAESVVLARLRREGPLRLATLPVATQEVVSRLFARGLLAVQRDTVMPAPSHESSAVVAIEAKLTRWRDALDQAVVYKAFADQSFVALPRAYSANAMEQEAVFASAGVGLLVVDGRRVVEVFPAPTEDRHDWRREFVYSRVRPHLARKR